MKIKNKYKDLNKFSKLIGIAPDRLVKAFEIEKIFHKKVLQEASVLERKKLYSEVYSTVHKIYGKTENSIYKTPNPKDVIVRMFRNELNNKSVLDVGCGEGFFLASISKQLKTKKLVGIDISIPEESFTHKKINFIKTDIIEFKLNEKFDVVFADQVIEHIAPKDLPIFLNSVKNVLNKNGLFVFLLPNHKFGPNDVTRIKDYSCTGKIKAEGTHLNEATFNELIPLLKKNDFSNFKTILQIPKIKPYLYKIRLNPNIFTYIENNKFLMWLIYKTKYRGLPIFRFETIIICSKQ